MSNEEGEGRSQFSNFRSDVNSRIQVMYEKQKQKDERLKLERTKKKLRELKECTFKPEIKSHYVPEERRPIVFIK